MKKSLQLAMNNWVLLARHDMIDELHSDKTDFIEWKKFRTCQAYVAETENFYILRSYNTIVACIRKNCLQSYDFLRYVYVYTVTSAQHISKFIHDYGDSRIVPYVYREV